jgi:hypothetical protein
MDPVPHPGKSPEKRKATFWAEHPAQAVSDTLPEGYWGLTVIL